MSVAEVLQERALVSYLQHARATSRVSIEGAVEGGGVVTLFHEWLLCVLAAAEGRPGVAVYVLDSPSTEGSARLIRRLGYPVILGRRDNAFGVREARAWLAQEGHVLAITLDGPSGPPRVAKAEVVRLARLARATLRGLDVSASSALRLRTWDRCVLPKIGGFIQIRVTPPVTETASDAEAAQALGDALGAARPHELSPRAGRHRVRELPAAVWARLCTMPLQYGRVTVWPRAPSPQSATPASSVSEAG